MTSEQLIALAKGMLDNAGHHITFAILEEGVRPDGSWWYVPVLATRNGKDVPREVTVNIYANIEDALETDHQVNVLFVPVTSESSVG